MTEPIHEKIKRTLQAAEGLYHRLVLLVGETGSGKTGVLRDVANVLSTEVINVNLALSRELLELTVRQRTLRLPDILDQVTDKRQSPVLLDNLEILFDKNLKQDPLRLLEILSRNQTVMASWSGTYAGGRLSYAEMGQDITYATNSQNPVDLRDLRSNDEIQKQLEIGISDLGYTYKRQREEGSGGSNVITSSIVGESVLSIWRERPHQAKFRRKEHFGKLYEDIFHGLNAAQALLAVLIFRAVENERKRPTTKTPPDFLPYASHYLSMLIGRNLLGNQTTALEQVSHCNFQTLVQEFESNPVRYHADAIQSIKDALKACYGERDISLQQLSATFRRGDLLEMLGADGTNDKD